MPESTPPQTVLVALVAVVIVVVILAAGVGATAAATTLANAGLNGGLGPTTVTATLAVPSSCVVNPNASALPATQLNAVKLAVAAAPAGTDSVAITVTNTNTGAIHATRLRAFAPVVGAGNLELDTVDGVRTFQAATTYAINASFYGGAVLLSTATCRVTTGASFTTALVPTSSSGTGTGSGSGGNVFGTPGPNSALLSWSNMPPLRATSMGNFLTVTCGAQTATVSLTSAQAAQTGPRTYLLTGLPASGTLVVSFLHTETTGTITTPRCLAVASLVLGSAL